LAEVFEGDGEGLWQGGGKDEVFAGHRMGEGELFGMNNRLANKGAFDLVGLEPVTAFEARKEERAAAIEGIASDGKASALKVNTDLMTAANEEFAVQKGPAGEAFADLEAGVGTFAAFLVDVNAFGFDGVVGEAGLDFECVLVRDAAGECSVLLADLFGTEHVCHGGEGGFGFGKKQDATGFGVEAMGV
jgi:hypothetical protein